MRGPTAGRPIPELSEADLRRFWVKVSPPNDHGCMEWAAVKDDGYGRFRLGGSKFLAHRISWTLANGPIPPGKVLDHLCRNRACVNPLHLEVVTNRENTVRGEAPRVAGQWHREKTHCPAGHAYDEANTYVAPNGGRRCRTCHRERERERARARRASLSRADVSTPST